MLKIKLKKYNKINFILPAIFLIALLPRLILAFYSTEIPTYDAAGYDERAISMLEGKGFIMNAKPTSFKEPFYSFLLLTIYFFYGHSYLAVRIIQAILGAFTCCIIFLISRKLFDFKTGLLSVLISSFYPAFIKSSEHLLTENFYTFILITAIFLLLRQAELKTTKNLIFLGIVLGIAALTRSAIFYFPLFILLFFREDLLARSITFKRYIFSITIFIFFYFLPIFPWTLRNWHVHHRIVPISTNTGINLYSSYFPKDGKFYGFTASDETTKRSEQLGSEMEQSNFLLKETLKFIKNNPLKVFKLELLKIAYFWSPFDWEIIGYGVYNFMYGFIFPFFVYGIFITLDRLRELLPIYLPVIYAFIIALITYGSPRFRLPIEPYLIIIASAGIIRFNSIFSKKIYSIFLTTNYFIMNLIFYFHSYQIKLLIRDFFKKIGFW